MGNVGSTHQLNLEDVNSEIHTYYKLPLSSKRQQSPIQRYDNINTNNNNTMHWTRSLPHIINNDRDAVALERDSLEAVPATNLQPNYKVLPQVNERLKLRPTTNGVILFSGGTISGKREQISTKTTATCQKPAALGLKQRARTFIYDDAKPVNWHYKQPTQQNTAQSQQHTDYRQSLPAFRRAQTLLELKSDVVRAQEAASKSLGRKMVYATTKEQGADEEALQKAKTLQRQANDSKQNKYNKKRKAPPAPTPTATAVTNSATTTATSLPITQNKYQAATMVHNSNTSVSKITANAENRLKNNNLLAAQPTKTRLFRANAKIPPTKQAEKKVQQTQNPHMDMVKDFATLTVAPTDVVTQTVCQRLQRGKSSDAILVRQKRTAVEQNKQQLATASAKLINNTKSQLESSSSKVINKQQQKLHNTKIPQLNRTFYFGMSTAALQAPAAVAAAESNSQSAPQIIPKQKNNNNENVEACNTVTACDYKLHASCVLEPIIDNGLLIQVRPTLPRRQHNTPSFSPVAAWRMLVEQQQQHKLEKIQKLAPTCAAAYSKEKNADVSNNSEQQSNLLPYLTGKAAVGMPSVRATSDAAAPLTEAPIKLTTKPVKCATTTYPNTWTPQQDLGDDEDEDEVADYIDGAVNTARIFPNDNVQQNNANCAPQLLENSTAQVKLSAPAVSRDAAIMDTTMSTTAMHVFSLTLPRDVHTQAQRKLLQSINTTATLPKEPARSAAVSSTIRSTTKPISLSAKCCCLHADMRLQQCLPLALDDNILPHENHCPLHYDLGIVISGTTPLSSLSDNWVLHKVKSDATEAQNTCRISTGERYSNWNTKVAVEPLSLSYLTAGKHVMYLPSKAPNTSNARNADTCSTVMQKCEAQQYKQQHRTEKILQHVSTHPATNVTVKAAAAHEKSQQFTFQSTIRRLQKRRLAERLAKDAKLKEAQRKSELEALKRVEDDFQRKRAFEKANIRYQLQLQFNAEQLKQHASATDNANLFAETAHLSQYDRNNNIACRAEPDGAVSTPPPPRCAETRIRECARNYSDCGDESDTDAAELVNFQHTETLLEPYLQSIIN